MAKFQTAIIKRIEKIRICDNAQFLKVTVHLLQTRCYLFTSVSWTAMRLVKPRGFQENPKISRIPSILSNKYAKFILFGGDDNFKW